jgi:hypothetical protein
VVTAENIVGMAHVAYKKSKTSLSDDLVKWLQSGENRFYFNEMYTYKSKVGSTSAVPKEVTKMLGAVNVQVKLLVFFPRALF